MPVPTLVTDLSTTLASNSPSGSDNVFPDLDNYLRALSGFVASIRDNSGNGWVSPYLPLTYSAGTANGVVYLNGSKVVTTGSALVFDGTNLGIGTSSPSYKLTVSGSSPDIVAANTGANGTRIAITASNTAAYVSTTYSGSGIPLIFNTAGIGAAGSTQMTLDSSGNFGLGVTPSATGASQKSLEIGSLVGIVANPASNTSSAYAHNAYYNGTNWIYRNTSVSAARYEMTGANAGSTHAWYVSAGGTAGNAISFTQAMTLEANGNMSVGTTDTTAVRFKVQSGSDPIVFLSGFSGAGTIGVIGANPLAIYTNGSERARITSGGDLLVGAIATVASERLRVTGSGSTNATYITYFENSSATRCFAIESAGRIYTGTAADSPYNFTTASAANLFVASDGTLYRSTSSLKYKTDVQDATHGLAEVMQLRPVTYKGKKNGDTVFGGLIAEEVHAAGLTEFVQYAPDGSPDALAYGNMVALLTKAIQEQQALMAALTARVAALEAQP